MLHSRTFYPEHHAAVLLDKGMNKSCQFRVRIKNTWGTQEAQGLDEAAHMSREYTIFLSFKTTTKLL